MKNKDKYFNIKGVVIVISSIILCVMLFVILKCGARFLYSGVVFYNPYKIMKYDAVVWKHYKGVRIETNPRGMMCNDIMNNYIKKGMTKNEVVNILGEPDQVSLRFKSFTYDVGNWDFINYSFFKIYYDDKDIVIKTSIESP